MAVMVVNAVVAKVAKHVAVPAKADAARLAAKPAWPDVAKAARTVAARRDQTIAVKVALKVVQKAAPTFVAKAAAKAGRNRATVNNAGVRAGASAAKAATEAVGTIVARHPPVKPLHCPPAARHRAKPGKPLTPSAATDASAHPVTRRKLARPAPPRPSR